MNKKKGIVVCVSTLILGALTGYVANNIRSEIETKRMLKKYDEIVERLHEEEM